MEPGSGEYCCLDSWERLVQISSINDARSVRLRVFIRPFEKRSYYAVAMSVRLSICPSFPEFFQHALRYKFETGYIHPVACYVEFKFIHNQVTLTYFIAESM